MQGRSPTRSGHSNTTTATLRYAAKVAPLEITEVHNVKTHV
ncbi:hypothetical protein QIS74_09441 [Colletotrichum tabaci]|uniref:Uncharacterized protein n=1 Tax=Colletotrichum tabaci TaxID=1209068 RepID=A0AAV9T4B7_9PEZI